MHQVRELLTVISYNVLIWDCHHQKSEEDGKAKSKFFIRFIYTNQEGIKKGETAI